MEINIEVIELALGAISSLAAFTASIFWFRSTRTAPIIQHDFFILESKPAVTVDAEEYRAMSKNNARAALFAGLAALVQGALIAIDTFWR